MYDRTDRRVFRRIEGEVSVRYTIPGSHKEHRTATRNISGGGMRIPILKRLQPGTVLDIEIFRDKSSRSAKCKGEIRWIAYITMKGKRKKSLEAGVKFLDLSFLFMGNLIGDLEARNITEQLSKATSK